MNDNANSKSLIRPLYGLSPVFKVAPPRSVSLSSNAYSVEKGDTLTVTAILSVPRLTNTPVRITMTGLSATGNGVDFDSAPLTITIPAGSTRATGTVATTRGTGGERDEAFRMDIDPGALPAGVIVGRHGHAAVTITAATPGLVFDKTHLRWNESDGCHPLGGSYASRIALRRDVMTNAPGPSYRVKLRTRPSSTVEIHINDPNALVGWGNRGATLNRVFAGDGPHGFGGISRPPQPELVFTPSNWDEWQTIRTRVVCADHSRQAVPLQHKVVHTGTGFQGSARPNYGAVGQTWTVFVHVKDAKPPIEVLDLPAAGQTITLEDGQSKNFRIRISDEILPDGSGKSLAVDVAAWQRGGPALVGRRDGTARSCGTFSDCMVFTPSSREQWVRLRGNRGGDATLFIRAYGLRGWGDSYNWSMRWPVEVLSGICTRTRQVRDAIVARVPGVSHCRDVTPQHLAAISGTLDVDRLFGTNPQAGDFDGLTGVTRLELDRNGLTTLPAGIFDDLTALTWLFLNLNSLETLPAGIFDQLSALEVAYLNRNRLATLPTGIFDRNTKLWWTALDSNQLATVPEGIFAGLQNFDGGSRFGQFLGNNPGAPFSPAANAGADQAASAGATVTLSGTATGPWGENVVWQWTQVDGPASTTAVTGGVTLTGANSATASFTAPDTPATLHFRLAAVPHVLLPGNRKNGIERGHDWVTVTVAGGQGDEVPTFGTAPSDPVSNLQVTAMDDTRAGVTWDAVDRATSYDVSWQAENGDGSASVNGVESVTGTSATILHDATEAMTLTVTVAPEYIDGNGIIQRLDGLAATATLAVGPGAGDGTGTGDSVGADTEAARAAAVAACVSDDLKATTERYYDLNSGKAPKYGRNWFRVMVAFGMRTPDQWPRGGDAAPYTAAEARTSQGVWNGWKPFAKALECIETEMASQPEQAQEPETAPVPEVTVSGGGGVTEGASAAFTVTANPAPKAPLQVTLSVGQDGDFAAAGETGTRTVTVPTGGSVGVDIPTVDDARDEPDGSVTVTVDPGTGYTVGGTAAHTVAVADNDEPVVSISAGTAVTEGTSATFTVTASPVPHAPLEVALTVSQDGDFAASGETGAKTVTVPVGGSVTLEVPTVNDEKDEQDGSITTTVDAGTGYAVAAAPGNAASVEVRDDDAAAGVPTLSAGDATGSESDRQVRFTVRLSRALDRHMWVYARTRDSTPVSAEGGRDYVPVRNRVVHFRPGETEHTVRVYVVDDSHDEDPETFELVLANVYVVGAPQGSVVIGDGVAVGTIVNDDPMPAAWLSRFGRTAAEAALDGIAGRMAAPRTAGVQGTIAGQALDFVPGSGNGGTGVYGAANDPGSQSGAGAAPGNPSGSLSLAQSSVARAFGAGNGGFGHEAHGSGPAFGYGSGGAQSYSMTARDALLGSSFTATGETDATGGSLAFWGRAAQSSFDGREGTFSLDGETTTAMLGADYARDKWLVGLALMQTSGEGGYADSGSGPQSCPDDMDADMMAHLCDGAVREGDGKVEASLTAAVPYAATQASERLKLWGAAGYGAGEVTLEPEVGGSLKTDIAWTMAALGLRGDVIAPPAEGSGLALAVTSDALWARTSSDRTYDLAASDSDVTRLRIGLEGSYRMTLDGGGSVTPKLEVGARHDGGGAETGAGLELGGGIAWVDPRIGLNLDLSGRTLVAHGSDELEDRGFAASLAWDPDPATQRGPSLTLTQDWGGQAQGGLDALFRTDPLSDRAGGGEATARWQAEAAWGFPAFSGRFTGSPHVGLGLATGARDYSLGWRLTPAANANAPDLSFGVKATRRENDGAEPEHTVGFEAVARW